MAEIYLYYEISVPQNIWKFLWQDRKKRWFFNTCDCITEVAAWTGLTVLAIIQEETLTFKKLLYLLYWKIISCKVFRLICCKSWDFSVLCVQLISHLRHVDKRHNPYTHWPRLNTDKVQCLVNISNFNV
jgi:hypothetical protein